MTNDKHFSKIAVYHLYFNLGATKIIVFIWRLNKNLNKNYHGHWRLNWRLINLVSLVAVKILTLILDSFLPSM